MTEASKPLLTVTVLQGETVVCVVDAGGRVLAPPGAADRAVIVSALGRAIAAVATLPLDETQEQDVPCLQDTINMLADRLAQIGTDQSTAVSELLTERLNAVAETMTLANRLIGETAIAESERLLGAVQH